MGDIGDRLRALFDDEARPIDPAYIPQTVQRKSSVRRRFSVRPGWQIGIAAGLIALVFGGSALLLRTGSDGETVQQTISATEPNESVPAASSQETRIEWSQGTLPEEFNVHTITAAGGYFFGLAWDEIEEPDPRTRLWLSADGGSWEAVDVDATAFGMRAGYFQRIAAVGDGFIAIVKGMPLTPGNPDRLLVTSSDARVWVPAAIGESGAMPAGIAGDETGGVAIFRSRDGDFDEFDVWHSIDGTTWALAASQTFSGIGSLNVEVIGGKFYLWPPGDGEGLWVSSNASEWVQIQLPPVVADSFGPDDLAGISASLLLITNREDSGARLWLNTAGGVWADVTPSGFDTPLTSGGGFGDQFISSSNGGPAIIVDRGSRSGPGPNVYVPASIWWTLDGAQWTELTGSQAFGSEGTIEVASVKGDTIVVVYYSEPDRVWSLWTGFLQDQLVDLELTPTTTAAPTASPVHYTVDLPGWVILNAWDGLDGSDSVQIVKTDPEDVDHPEFAIISGPEATNISLQLTDGVLPSLDTRSVQGTEATIFRLRQGGSFDLLWVDNGGAPVVFEFTKVKDVDVERILSALRPMTDEEWAAISVDLSTTTSSVPVQTDSTQDHTAMLGDPISDDEFRAMLFIGFDPVPDSARRLAWTSAYLGRYSLGLFYAEVVMEGSDPWFCIFEYGAASDGDRSPFGGGGQCAPTPEMISFGVGGGGTCLEPVTNMLSVWGVPESAESVVFELSDGTQLVGQTVNGVAQVAWGSDQQVRSVTFEGATADQIEKLTEFTDTDYSTCAEVNG